MSHIGGHPEDCCLEHLELCTADENKDLYSAEANDLFCSVFKRPACKRPAAACKRPAAASSVKKIVRKRPASSG